MHAVKDGPADRSYGLQVAALAGLPRAVIAEARHTLDELERGMRAQPSRHAAKAADTPQLALFSPSPPSAVERELERIDPEALSPREALDVLFRLKQLH
jgi:DNA mismatch repair protein MutS